MDFRSENTNEFYKGLLGNVDNDECLSKNVKVEKQSLEITNDSEGKRF